MIDDHEAIFELLISDPAGRGFDPSTLGWYALRVPAQREFVAAEILERRGYVTFVPVFPVWRRVNRYARAKKQFDVPLLIRYVLVGFAGDRPPWLDVFALKVVEAVVGVGDQPERIAWPVIREFIDGDPVKRLAAPKVHRHMRTHHEFKIGDQCEVVEGPFSGHILRVEGIWGAKARGIFADVAAKVGVELPLDILERRD